MSYKTSKSDNASAWIHVDAHTHTYVHICTCTDGQTTWKHNASGPIYKMGSGTIRVNIQLVAYLLSRSGRMPSIQTNAFCWLLLTIILWSVSTIPCWLSQTSDICRSMVRATRPSSLRVPGITLYPTVCNKHMHTCVVCRPACRYASEVLAKALCPSVHHKSRFCWNSQMNKAGFRHTGFPWTILHCAEWKFR